MIRRRVTFRNGRQKMETLPCPPKTHKHVSFGSALGLVHWVISAGGSARTLQKTNPNIPRKEKGKGNNGKGKCKGTSKGKGKGKGKQKGKRRDK